MDQREQRWRKQLLDYSPRIDGEAWAMIRPRLLEWMERIGPASAALTKDLLFNLTRLAAHCWEQGWDLTPETVLSEAVVEHHIAVRARKGQADNPHARTTLRQARLALINGETLGVRFTRPQVQRSPAPFERSDYAGIESWARSRQDADHPRTACAIAALGMGAGLRAAEMASVTRADVLHLPGGLSVKVTVGRPRTVPLLHNWEPLLHMAMERPGRAEHLVGVTGNVASGNYVGEFTTRSGGPDSRRMRVTWLVTHLQFGTPLDLLLATAGNTTLDQRLAGLAMPPVDVGASAGGFFVDVGRTYVAPTSDARYGSIGRVGAARVVAGRGRSDRDISAIEIRHFRNRPLVPLEGLEPPTLSLGRNCSSIELQRPVPPL